MKLCSYNGIYEIHKHKEYPDNVIRVDLIKTLIFWPVVEHLAKDRRPVIHK